METKVDGLDLTELPDLTETTLARIRVTDLTPKRQSPAAHGKNIKQFDTFMKLRITKELLHSWYEYTDRHGLNASQEIRDMIRRRIRSEEFMIKHEIGLVKD